jgi:phosphoglycolate phosphatase-like HAD superfamily hydrolase
MSKKLIALDADGVLLDYSLAYASAWEKAFGVYPTLKNPNAYWPIDRWAVDRLSGSQLDLSRSVQDDAFWSTIPAINGAIEACHLLRNAGYELICVTALKEKFRAARQKNLLDLGFPIEIVMTVEHTNNTVGPKAAVINSLKPLAFVDDYLPYMAGIDTNIHLALIMRDPDNSPNTGVGLDHIHSNHTDLQNFVMSWLNNYEA